jgi:UDP-N-acetyl-D-galactosamine dehydrogenase
VKELQDYDVKVTIYDPWANPTEVNHEYGVMVLNELPEKKFDGVVLAVAHDELKKLDLSPVVNGKSVVFDVKGMLNLGMIDGRL